MSALAAAVVATTSTGAFAHGGFFRAYDVVFEPGNPDHVILRSDVWGFVETKDAGQSWHWSCAEVYSSGGDSSSATKRRSVAILPGGKVLVTVGFDGLSESVAGSSCEFETRPEFTETTSDGSQQGAVVNDVHVSADGQSVWVVSATGLPDIGVVSRLWRSTDNGNTWAAVAEIPGDAGAQFSANSIVEAPSNPDRLYVAGKLIGGTSGTVQRSDDGGATWQIFEVPVTAENWSAKMHGVDPNDPDVAYFWVDGNEGSGAAVPDSIWMTVDGGATWSEVVTGAGDLSGFAFSPDGSRLAVSGPEDGVLTASAAEVPASGSAAFTQVNDGQFWGLHWQEGTALYAGTNDFTAGDAPKFTFGVSADEGVTFESAFEICDTVLLECATDSSHALFCPDQFSEPTRGGFYEDFVAGPRCAGGAGTTDGGTGVPGGGTVGAGGVGAGNGGTTSTGGGGAGAPPDDGGDTGGCSCRVPRGGGSPRVPTGLALVVVGLAAASCRRRLRAPLARVTGCDATLCGAGPASMNAARDACTALPP